MSWKCPRCSRINHSSPSRCSCGQRVRSTSSSSSQGDDGLDLIYVEALDVYPSGRYDSYSSDSSYSDSSYNSSSSYDSGSSSSDSSSSD